MNTKTENTSASVIVTSVITIVIFGLVIYGLVHAFKTPVALNDTQPLQVTSNTTSPMDTNTTTNTDRVAKNGDTLVMNYTGRLTNGTVFDSNIDPKFNHVQPFEFVLGAHQVIPGWDKGLVGMKVGEKKTLTIPPEDAYGAAGAGSAIPPNATLIFDVQLIAIK